MLSDNDKSTLTDIVTKMDAAKASPDEIQTVVTEFQKKYDKPEGAQEQPATNSTPPNKGNILTNIANGVGGFVKGLGLGAASSAAGVVSNRPELEGETIPEAPTPQESSAYFASKAKTAPEKIGSFMGQMVTPTSPLDLMQIKPASLAIKSAVKAVAGAGKLTNTLAGKVAQELSGVSEEALRMAGTKEGRAALAAGAGKQNEIGQKIVEMIHNPTDYLPEANVIDGVLDKMEGVPRDNIIAALEKAKNGLEVTPTTVNVNKRLDQMINNLKKIYPVETNISARDLRDIRMQIDADIPWGTAEAKPYNKALMDVRTKIKDDLLDAADKSGVPEYKKAMGTLSDKLDKIELAKKIFGGEEGLQAQGVVRTMFNKDRAQRFKAINALKDVFGEDFVKQAKIAQLADQLGENGAATWMPRHTTGRAGLATGLATYAGHLAGGPAGLVAGAPMIALSSPKIASRFALPVTQGIQDIAAAAGSGLQKTSNLLKKNPLPEISGMSNYLKYYGQAQQ